MKLDGRAFLIRCLMLPLLLMAGMAGAKDITPLFRLEASGMVNDLVVEGDRLYVATDAGSIDIFDLRSRKAVDRIVLPPLQSVRGEAVPASILSVDRYRGMTLFVSRAQNSYREVWIDEGMGPRKVRDAGERLFVKRARFTREGRVAMVSFGSDAVI